MIGRGKRQSRKSTFFARFLCSLLTFAMLLTSSGFQVLAAEFSADVVTFEQSADDAMRAQAEADAEAARLAAEAQAAGNAGAAPVTAGGIDTFDIFSSEAVDVPVVQSEPEVVKETKLVLRTDEVSTQEEGEYAKLNVTYELGKDSAIPVETRMYIGSETVQLPQFDEDGKYVNPETGRTFLVKTTEEGNLYVEYILQAGESFTEEFLFGDASVVPGSYIEFNVVISAFGDVPAEHEIQATPAKVVYTLPKEETEKTPVEEIEDVEAAEGTEENVEGETEDAVVETEEPVADDEETTDDATEETADEVITEEPAEDPVADDIVEEETEDNNEEVVVEIVEENVATEAVIENVVTFEVAEGAVVTVDGVDVTNATAMAKNGTIYFVITAEEGYVISEVLVDGTIPARTTENDGEYIIERIQTDETIVTVDAEFIEGEEIVDADAVVEEETEEGTEGEEYIESTDETVEDVEETEETSEDETVEDAVDEVVEEIVEDVAEEEEYGTSYVGYGDGVTVYAEASVEAMIPADAELVARVIPVGSPEYIDAVALMEEQMEVPEGYEAVYEIWDVYFLVDGQEVEPAEGLVTVWMEFTTPILEEAADAEEAVEEYSVLHINDEAEVSEVTDSVEVNADGTVDAVGFTTDSFSLIAARGLMRMMAVNPIDEDSSIDMTQLETFIYNATIVPDDGKGEPGEDPTVNNGSCMITLQFKENSAYGGEQFAQTLYYNLPDGITVYKNVTGDIKGSGDLAGSILGTYEIKTPASKGAPATLTITFNDEIKGQPFDSYNNLNCTFEFKSWFNVEISQDGEGKTFQVGDEEITLYFKDGKKWSGNKSASTYYKGTDGNPGYFEYTVEVISDEPIDAGQNIVFQDIMDSNLSLIANSIVIKGMDKTGYTIYENKDIDNSTGINGFSIVINQAIAAHTPIEIKYKAVINNVDLVDENGNVEQIGNTIYIDKGGTDQVALPAEPTYKPGAKVTKSNDGFNSATGKVKWTVTINPNGDRNMSNVLITDRLQDTNASYDTISSTAPQCNQVMPEDFTWEKILSSDRKSWSYKLPSDAGFKTYIFTYETIMPSNTSNMSYQNNIYLDGNLTTSDSVNVPGTGTGTGVEKVSKNEQIVKEDNVDVRYVWWESKITIPAGGATNVIYTDELTGSHELEDVDSFKENLTIKDQNGNSITPISINRESEKKFTINFGNVPESASGLIYTIRYRTKTTANGTIYNTGILYANGKYTSSPANHLVQDYSFTKSGTVTDKNNGIITWRVILNDGKFDLIDKNIIISDTFPESLVYVKDSAKLYRNNSFRRALTVTGEDYIKDNVVIGKKAPIEITVGEVEGPYQYYVEYETKLIAPLNIGEISTFTNKATIKDDDRILGEPSASATISNKVLNKSIAKYATAENSYWVTYEVILNEEYQPFPEGTTTFSIRDVMSANQEVDTESVVLQRQKQTDEDWTDVPESEYVKNALVKNILTIDVSTTYDNINRVAYKLKYNAHVSQMGQDDLEDYTNDITYTVAGNPYEDGSDGTADFGQDSSASGTGNLPFIIIKKAELGNVNILLPNAVFTLYREDSNGNEVLVKDDLKTDKNGELVFGKGKTYDVELNTDTKYILREKTAPNGYLKANDVEFYLSGGEVHTNGWSGDVAHFVYDAKAVKVNATKTWEIPEGTVTPEVSFTLYSKYSDESDSEYKPVANAEVFTIQEGDAANKTFTWENLPYHEITGEGADTEVKVINYTVVETFVKDGEKYSQLIGKTTLDTSNTSDKTVVYNIDVNNATTEHTVTKTWNDNNNALGNRPTEITVKLYRNNAEYKTYTLTATDNWSYTWTGLQKYDDKGKPYTYRAEEVVPAYYDQKSNNGSTIVNRPENEVVGHVVTKEWNDSNNQDGKRPQSITLKLYYNNSVVDADFINKYNGYSSDATKKDTPIQYRYQTGDNKWSEWTDYTEQGATVEGDASTAEWKCEWRNLPKYISQALVSYDAEEVTSALPEGYTADAAKAGADNKIINSYTTEKTEKTVIKYWANSVGENDDRNRPSVVTVQLIQNYIKENSVVSSNYGTSVELKEGNSWTYTWGNLPKYVRTDGESYEAYYTVKENTVPHYVTTYYNGKGVNSSPVKYEDTTGTTVSIKNTYTPEKINIEATKVWIDNSNADKIRPDSIVLALEKMVDGDSSWEEIEKKTISKNADDEGNKHAWAEKAVWNNLLKYENKKAVKYRVVEIGIDNTKYVVSYSDDYIVSTNVADNATDTIVVTNTHGAKTEVQFTAKKEISGNRGEAVKADEFTFVLSGSNNVNDEKATAADGTVTFDKIVYTSEGDYNYTIKEITPESGKVPGITYSTEEYNISVSVDMNDAGQLIAESTITKNGKTVKDIVFTNKYIANGKGSVTISKKLVGKNMTAGEFVFGLFTSDDVEPTVDNAVKTATSIAAPDNTAVTFEIDTPDYNQEHISSTPKIYYLREIVDTNKEDKIYDYDDSVYKVYVVVADGDAHDGNLKVTATVDGTADNKATFVNDYLAEGGLTLSATKTIDNKNNIPDSEFEFELYKLENEDSEVTGEPIQTKKNTGASISFDTIEYKTSDIGKTYYYAVKEKDGTKKDTYTYSTELYRVKAVIGYGENDGEISVTETYYKGSVVESNKVTSIIFTNSYKANGSIVLDGKKNLDGTNLSQGMFSFTLKKVNKDGTETEEQTVTNAADGTITFNELTYSQDDIGEHHYKIYESATVNGEVNEAYTFAEPIEVTVTVKETDTNKLSVTADKDGIGTDGIIFNNKYEASVEVNLAAKKTLSGRNLVDKQFEFTLTSVADENANIKVDTDNLPQIKQNEGKYEDESGKITFDKLSYDQYDVGKTYKYILKETAKGAAGYTYDTTEYVVTVKITDPNNNGVLDAEVKVDGNLYDPNDVPVFENSYAAIGEVIIGGTKSLTGKTLEYNEFTFELYEDGERIREAKNSFNFNEKTNTSEFKFEKITYDQTQIGYHTYTVIERLETKAGYTFDKSEYQVKVNVTDNGDGTLKTDIEEISKIKDKQGNELTTPVSSSLAFSNIYKSEGSAVLQATKVLNGQNLKDNMFTFILRDANGKIDEKTNVGDTVTFDKLEYNETELGEHVYYIEEVDDEKEGYTYSKEVYTVTVTVAENSNHNGELVTSVEYKNTSGDTFDKAEFINTYAADGEITISGTKTLTGNRAEVLKEEEFSFELTDKDGNVLETVKNDKDGKFTFSKLTYSAESVNNIEGKADFEYYVNEVIPDSADEDEYDYSVGINKYKVIVHVADDKKGGLNVTKDVKVTVDGNNYTDVVDDEIIFTNHYNAEGELELEVQKSTNIPLRSLKDNVFSFRLAGSGVNEVVNSDKETGKAEFTTIEYDEADIGAVYFYTITELRGRNAGYDYSNEIYLVRVEISDNGDGTLKVDTSITNSEGISVTKDNLVFNNQYKAEGELNLLAKKILEGRNLEKGKFTFVLESDGIRTPEEKQEKTNETDGTVTFDTISYNETHISDLPYSYKVYEKNDGKAGYSYDNLVYTVSVKVEDNGNGKLKVTPTFFKPEETNGQGMAINSVNQMVFTNTYEAEGEVDVIATKTLTGKKIVAEQFEFTLSDEKGNVLQTKKNAANGTVVFDNLTYDEIDTGKTFIYTIKEVIPEDIAKEAPGYTYDSTLYELKVTVADETDNGELEITKVITRIVETADGPARKEVKDIEFNNIYEATGQFELSAKKTLDGRNLEAGQFTFVLESNGIGTPNEKQEVTNAADGTITFAPIVYDQDDVRELPYSYKVYEKNDGKTGYTYDDLVYTVSVSVTDPNGNGELSVVPTIFKPETVTDADGNKLGINIGAVAVNEITFANEYKADGELVVNATKKLTGRPIEAGQFEFVLKAAEGTPVVGGADGELKAVNNADGSVKFEAIKYNEKDAGKTYVYTVNEVLKAAEGYIYDETVYTVTVVIVDNGNGTLTPSVTYSYETEKTVDGKVVTENNPVNAITFNNVYEAEGDVTITATKALSGRVIADNQFAFSIAHENGEVIETVSNIGKDVTFSTITYDETHVGKTFVYLIKEVIPEPKAKGYTYDETTYKVTVTVADETDDSDLEITKVITKLVKAEDGTLSEEKADTITFGNTYKAEGKLDLIAYKMLNNRELEADKFTFVLESNGFRTPEVKQTKTNAVDGTVTFDSIVYNETHVSELPYSYKVYEVNDGKAGYTYDDLVYTVSVRVTDNGDGTLTATPTFFKPEDASDNNGNKIGIAINTAEKMVFTNTYDAEGEVEVSATKSLTGRPLAADQFAFTLADAEGNVLQTKKNAADGIVVFDNLVYDEADTGKTFTYMIKEVIPEDLIKEAPGYTYDSASYELKVTIADETDNGELEITKVITRIVETENGPARKEVKDIAFNNTYEAKGQLDLSAKKVLNGRVLEEGQFTFVLENSGLGTPKYKQEVTNAADGSITFEPITYTQDDVRGLPYSYKVYEVNTGDSGYTYDSLVYTVSVQVKDNGNGTLTPVATIFKPETVKDDEGNKLGISIGTVAVDEMTFSNDYDAAGELVVTATKVLEGRDLEESQFTFELKDADGKVLQTKTNAANGSVVFDALQYTEADAGKTYTYTVNEVLVDADGYTYDKTVYTVTAEIIDDKDGTLTVNATYSYEADVTAEDGTVTTKTFNVNEIKFNNIYNANGEVTFTATKSLAGRAIEDGQFEFAVTDINGNIIETKANVGNNVTFSKVTYNESHVGQTFVYFIYEVIPADKAPGYTYDESIYKVTVAVADDEVDGKLEITETIEKLVEDKDGNTSEEKVEAIAFNNNYEATGKLDLTASKALIGRELAEGQFTFVLESSGLRTPEVKQTKTNAADGTVTFDSIVYDETHVSDLPYSYKVYEVNDAKAGYTYDDLVYTVSVLVTDNGDGTLKATPTFFKSAPATGEDGKKLGIAINPVKEMTFTNTYKAEGAITLEAEKVFAEGVQAKVEDGRFTFEISEEGGFKALVTNVGNKVTFPEIKYVHELSDTSQPLVPALGEHTYTIKEVNDSAENKDNTTVFFDTTEYTVKVMVTDNGDGTLKAEITSITVGEETKEKVVFTNDVTRLNITKVDITNDKELAGATLELKDAEENVIDSWTSDDKTHYIEDKLEIGKVYTLTETVAPEGYSYVTDITFTIDKDGNVVTDARVTTDEAGNKALLVEDAPIKATISKVDIVNEGKELVGASMQIMDAEGKEIVKTIYGEELKWVSGEEAKEIVGLPAGNYILRETSAPDGYTIAEDVPFTVSADMKVDNKVVMKNVAIRLEITKTGFTKDNKVVPLEGAMLEIREATESGEIGDIAFNVYGEKMRFESAAEAIALNGVKPGKYWLVETDAPEGYAIAEPIQITINEDMTVSQNPVTAIMEDCPIEVEVSKVDITNGEELAGATLQILTVNEDGTAGEIATTIYYVDDETTPEDKLEWVSGDTPRVIKGLAEGNYILREITAPAGYTVAVDVPFTVGSDLGVVNKVVMEDAPTEIVVSKTTLTGETELAGAHLEIQDAEGNVATTIYGEELSWVSTTDAKEIKGLAAGNYTLVETQAPNGYAYAEAVEFTVTDKVGVVNVSMKDDTTKVEISKYDVTNEKELAGAHLILKDSEGNIVADWMSNGTPKLLEGELIAGAEYTLSEVSAPAGYAIAKDITFKVNMDGTLQKVVMEDKESEGNGQVIVQKLVMQDGELIAVDYTFYVALFADEDCTERVTSVKPLIVSGSYTTQTIFTNLPYGTYYVAETDEFGNLAEEDFIIERIQVVNEKAELLPSKATAESTIINHVAGFDDHFYKSGEIIVNKSVVNADGDEVMVDDTFFFALFTDAALTNMADAGIVELRLNNASEGTVVFSDLPLGSYYLAETDEDGVPVGSAFEYVVTIDSSYCKLDEANTSIERTIVNTVKEDEDEVPTVTPTPSPTPGTPYYPNGGSGNPSSPIYNSTTSVTPVKTGDDTPVLPYAAGAFASLLAAMWAAVLAMKRRKRNNG